MEDLSGVAPLRLLYAHDALVPNLSLSQQQVARKIIEETGCKEVAAMTFTGSGTKNPGFEAMRSGMTVGNAIERIASSAALSECVAGPLYVGERYIPQGIALYEVPAPQQPTESLPQTND